MANNTEYLIEKLFNEPDAHVHFPTLVRHLIQGTRSSGITPTFRVPEGKHVFHKGADGKVKMEIDSEFIPKGFSIWELKTGYRGNIKSAFNEDIKKRTTEYIDKPVDDTKPENFIFCCLEKFDKKGEVIAKWKAQTNWDNIQIIDGEGLAEWLKISPYARIWLQEKLGEAVENIDYFTAENFLHSYSKLDKSGKTINPSFFTVGNDEKANELIAYLGNPGVKNLTLKSTTSLESQLFLAATVYKEEQETLRYLPVLFVTSSTAMQKLLVQNWRFIVVPLFEPDQLSWNMASTSETVSLIDTLKFGNGLVLENQIITLNKADFYERSRILHKAGIQRNYAEIYCEATNHNLPSLLRLLDKNTESPEWRKEAYDTLLFILALMGNIDPKKDFDFMKMLKGVSKEFTDQFDLEDYLYKLSQFQEPFVLKHRDDFEVSCRIEAIHEFLPRLSLNQLDDVLGAFGLWFLEPHPKMDLPPLSRGLADYYKKSFVLAEKTIVSLWKGLALLGAILDANADKYGHLRDRMNFRIREAFDKPLLLTGSWWKSWQRFGPEFAQISPETFLLLVDQMIIKESLVKELATKEEGFLFASDHLNGITKGLSLLCWDNRYVSESLGLMAKIAEIQNLDDHNNFSSRELRAKLGPLRIYSALTLQNYLYYLKGLENLMSKEGFWKLVTSLMPQRNQILETGSQIYSLRYPKGQIYKSVEEMPLFWKICTDLWDFTYELLKDDLRRWFWILDQVPFQHPDRRGRFPEQLRDLANRVDEEGKLAIRNELRQFIGIQRSYKDKKDRLPEKELKPYLELYLSLEPEDLVLRHRWLFEKDSPKIMLNGKDEYRKQGNSRREHLQIIQEKSLTEIERKYGWDGILRLVDEENTWFNVACCYETWGKTNEKIESNILPLLNSKSQNHRSFAFQICWFISKVEKSDWAQEAYKQIQSFSFEARLEFLLMIKNNESFYTWFEELEPELQSAFWTKLRWLQVTEKQELNHKAFDQLILHKNWKVALDRADDFISFLKPESIWALLDELRLQKADFWNQHEAWILQRVFEGLAERSDIERQQLALRQLALFPLLKSGQAKRKTLSHLVAELDQNPEWFVEILKMLYRPENFELLTEDEQDRLTKTYHQKAEQAYHILEFWDDAAFLVSGQENLEAWESEFKTWFAATLELAKKEQHERHFLIHVGTRLGQTIRENIYSLPVWIPDFLETQINNDFWQHVETGIHNGRGVKVRVNDHGGKSLFGTAAFLRTQAEKYNPSHLKLFKALNRTADSFEAYGRWERDE